MVFTLEPEAINNPYGTHTWGKWAKPDPKDFLYVHTRNNLNAVVDLANRDLPPSKQLSSSQLLSQMRNESNKMGNNFSPFNN